MVNRERNHTVGSEIVTKGDTKLEVTKYG